MAEQVIESHPHEMECRNVFAFSNHWLEANFSCK